MKKKILVGVLAMLFTLMLGMGTVMADFVITDTDEEAIEMEYKGAWLQSTRSDSIQLEFNSKGIDKDTLEITTLQGETTYAVVLGFGETGMDKSTMAVSGSAITYAGDYEIFSDAVLYATGDNQVRVRLMLEGIENLPAGTYSATLPAGCITVRSADETKQLYTNKEFNVELEILAEAPELTAPVIELKDNKISWEPVDGAAYYTVYYYENGIEPANGHFTIDENMGGMAYGLDIRSNFPYQPGCRYTVEVTAYPFLASTEGAVTAEYVLYEKMSSERVEKPDVTMFEWVYSDTSKDYTILKNLNEEADRAYFYRLYALLEGEQEYSSIMRYRTSSRTGEYNTEVSSRLTQQESKSGKKVVSFYMEVCAVDWSNPDIASSEWVKTEVVVVGAEAADKILEDIDSSDMSAEEVQEVTDKLLEKSTKEELSEALMDGNKDAARTGYEALEEAAREAKNVNVTGSVADDVKDLVDAASIKTAGLAINAVSGSSVTLEVKKPEKEIEIPAGYNKAGAVQLDIDVPAIEEFEYPVMITMKIPASLNPKKKIVIFHEGEKIYPIINGDGTMTFSVTHFSVFAFANEQTSSGGGSSSSSSDSSSSNRVISNNTTVAPKTGTWVLDNTGWWFSFADKTYPVSTWLKVNEKWYYFDAAGYMLTGWQMLDGKWYYLDAVNGDMAEGWKFIDGKWYYLNPVSGDMAEGWKVVDGKWYYLMPVSGECLLDTVTPDGYKVDANGAWIQ